MTKPSMKTSAPELRSLSDEEVISRVAAGETELFELIMRRHNARLFRATRSILRDEAEAEDAVQQTYISAYEHLDQFHGDAQFSTWLTRIAIRAALRRLKAAQRRAQIQLVPSEEDEPLPVETPRQDPEDAAAAAEIRSVVERAVDGLPEIYRIVFVLREIQQLSTAETAASLEVSEEVIKIRLFRAKQMLRAAISSRLDAVAPEIFAFLGERCERIVTRVMAQIVGAHRQSGD